MVVRGYALDIFVGRATRPHRDIDVGVPRHLFGRLRQYLGDRLELVVAQDGKLRQLPDTNLEGNVNGLWARDNPDAPWRMQVNLDSVEHGMWIYRRDERVRRSLCEVVWRAGELPYRNPAVGLLWKARDATATDEFDFANVEPLLPPGERAWLAHAIATAHPASPWSARIARAIG